MVKIIIPFPVWEFLFYRQEKIASLLNNNFGVEGAPKGTPRSIEFKKIKPEGKESDRLKVKLWYPGGTYVNAVIAGKEDFSYGTQWTLISYKAKWSFWGEESKIFCTISAAGEIVAVLEEAAHSLSEEAISKFKSFDVLKIEA